MLYEVTGLRLYKEEFRDEDSSDSDWEYPDPCSATLAVNDDDDTAPIDHAFSKLIIQ